ncbi:MAG: ABC transporter permease [Ilumatobacter sp.]|uniref:ABC transporter permease n=1 Tax=Ilumatobacter sp. TaxID=1967498 RepID=UPI0026048CEC|nr:ABC transporter permease [Ilumatobacter sp.]MDJ0768750.1 ABC transporter permease [Ilumatobacter sp.]
MTAAAHAPNNGVDGSRLRAGDIFRVGAAGPRARKMRTALSALGVSIGIAAMVGVLGLSESSKSALLDEISALGTNLLTVEAGAGFGGGNSELPESAVASIERLDTVESAAAVYTVDASILKNEFVDPGQTGGLSVVAADTELLDTLNGAVVDGQWLDEATSQYPAVALGSVSAERLGITSLDQPTYVYVGEQYVQVVGILDEFPLSADLDRAVIMGRDAAQAFYDAGEAPTTIYTRVVDGEVDATRDIIPATADAESPEEVTVSRPTDALEAEAAADDALTTLFLGLGAVALLVGGIGIANVMVIAVIERRGEIGLRRALGATRAHIRRQFLTEAVLLSALGGIAGVGFGIVATYVYSATQDWRVIIPTEAAAGGFVAALLIGAIAGLYPATRAARLAPTEALRA